jgi:hypothetical protein
MWFAAGNVTDLGGGDVTTTLQLASILLASWKRGLAGLGRQRQAGRGNVAQTTFPQLPGAVQPHCWLNEATTCRPRPLSAR